MMAKRQQIGSEWAENSCGGTATSAYMLLRAVGGRGTRLRARYGLATCQICFSLASGMVSARFRYGLKGIKANNLLKL